MSILILWYLLYNSILGVYYIISGRIVKEVANGVRKVSIILAEEVQDKGYKRVIDIIDLTMIIQIAEKVANVFSGSKIITAGQKARAGKIIITYAIAQVKT